MPQKGWRREQYLRCQSNPRNKGSMKTIFCHKTWKEQWSLYRVSFYQLFLHTYLTKLSALLMTSPSFFGPFQEMFRTACFSSLCFLQNHLNITNYGILIIYTKICHFGEFKARQTANFNIPHNN